MVRRLPPRYMARARAVRCFCVPRLTSQRSGKRLPRMISPGLRHAFCTSLVGVLLVSLSGCITALAVSSLPDAAKLKPLPDKHFRVAMSVVLNGQSRTVEHLWRCTHERVFSAGTGWGLVWRSEGRRYMVKVLGNGLIVFFREPTSNYCYRDGSAPYVADIGVISNPSTLDGLVVHHVEQFPQSDAIVGGSVERLGDNPMMLSPSVQERDLEARLRAYEDELVSSSVTITPESIWSRYPELNSYFRPINVVTVAPPPTHPQQPLGFSVRRGSPLSNIDVHRRLYYSVQDIDGIIKFNPSRTPEKWVVFRRDRRDFRRNVTFCYSERCVELGGDNYHEIYDPQSRNIIGVWHSSPLRNEVK